MTRIHAPPHLHAHPHARRALAHVAARSTGKAIDPSPAGHRRRPAS
ncbi:hypothetical protein PV371_14930 [Streptomyces sp. TX20-6-3]|nr:hypothetical protein [Streptomyces sp. TX20-6-3]MDX2560940.1 hypothetical protein [Streptomyces sp. TX20-6-3]